MENIILFSDQIKIADHSTWPRIPMGGENCGCGCGTHYPDIDGAEIVWDRDTWYRNSVCYDRRYE